MTDRQLKEIAFCILYARFFDHGTDGHNGRGIIALESARLGYEVQLVDGGFVLSQLGKPLLTLKELPTWNPI